METTTNDIEYVETIDESTPHEFSSPWHFSDVVLVVEGIKFHVHKSTLSIWSPVFHTMFTSQFKESTAEEIPLPGKRADEVEQLLKIMYFDDAKQEVTETNYEFLLELAGEYQMDRILRHCGRYMEQDIDEENCLHRYNIAERFGLEDVMKKCNEKACFKSSTDLEENDNFLNLEYESKFKLCMARVKELEDALEKYVRICSELVSEYYEELSLRMSNCDDCYYSHMECDNQSSHSAADSSGGMVKKKGFDSSCSFCRKRVERFKDEIDDLYLDALHYDDLFRQLYDLELEDKVAKIIEKMKVSVATVGRKLRFK